MYRGNTIHYSTSGALIGMFQKESEVQGLIIWRNGCFFKGTFKNRKPSHGLFVESPNRYYYGDVLTIYAKTNCVPHGIGKMFSTSCDKEKGVIMSGSFNYGKMTSSTSENVSIHIFNKDCYNCYESFFQKGKDQFNMGNYDEAQIIWRRAFDCASLLVYLG